MIGMTAFAQTGTAAMPQQGIWSYSVPDAPDGYHKGTIEFKQVDDRLTATVKTTNGTFTIREIRKTEQRYTCSLYVDGADVSISFDPKPELITGIVRIDTWEMPITLTPVKE
jgi:hypothetical protein